MTSATAAPTTTTSVIETVTTSADGYGRWRAKVEFSRGLSESDPREEFNLGHHWPNIRRRARDAIVNELVAREQKTTETHLTAERRIRASLGRLEVAKQDIDSMNIWYGVTFSEPVAGISSRR